MNFNEFVLRKEDEQDIKNTIKNLPKSVKKMLNGYEYKLQSGNTLKFDKEHVGYIDEEKKIIVIAAPYYYAREFTLLHEVGHLVWKYFVNQHKRDEWKNIVKKTKNKQDQNDEELFCMNFANVYGKHKVEIHNHTQWIKFIKSLSL